MPAICNASLLKIPKFNIYQYMRPKSGLKFPRLLCGASMLGGTYFCVRILGRMLNAAAMLTNAQNLLLLSRWAWNECMLLIKVNVIS